MDYKWSIKQLTKIEMKKKKIVFTILSIFLLVGLIGGLIAYKEYNRKNIDISDTKAAFELTDIQLLNEFTQDPIASNKKYLGKILELSGKVKNIDIDANGYQTIILGTDSSMNSVRCSIDSSFKNESHILQKGSTVIVKGICTGYNADDLGLGSDIILNRSITIKK